ncbi:MAG TPA: YHS domain-containing (seleno)protein [Verrucomicrobiae bacterium]|jgi:YHS domain-containing protein|nr:YHS domain-containing (seleno)protein [Verrucomicrobiae bacterium]
MRKLLLAIAIATASIATPALADQAPVHTALLSRLAVGGYDPVAYFTDGRPVRGTTGHRTTHQGYEYRFTSAEHLAAFRANPSRYLPQYGGYCAWAVANGYTAAGNPNNWRIVDGRLYLNYNDEIQTRWERDIPGFIRSANTNWPSVLSR